MGDLSRQMAGVTKLAMIGVAAIYVAVVGSVVGLICLGLWVWNHVSIH